MTNRELLELAAKACGYEWRVNSEITHDGLWIDGVSTYWNPRTDDGDNRRLQVALKISLEWVPEDKLWDACIWIENSGYWIEKYHTDSKMAVLLVAAELGKAMP